MSLRDFDKQRKQVLKSRSARTNVGPTPDLEAKTGGILRSIVKGVKEHQTGAIAVTAGVLLTGATAATLAHNGIYPRIAPVRTRVSRSKDHDGFVNGQVEIKVDNGIVFAEGETDSRESHTEFYTTYNASTKTTQTNTRVVEDPTPMSVKSFTLTVNGRDVVTPLSQSELVNSGGYTSRTDAITCLPAGTQIDASMVVSSSTGDIQLETSWTSDGECMGNNGIRLTEAHTPEINAGIGV